jgi:hypothetical protein
MCTPSTCPAVPSGSFFGDDLHHAFGLADDLGPAVEAVRVLADDDVDAGRLARVLARPGPGDLRVAVDRPGDAVVHDRHRRLAEQMLDHEHRLGVADVRQLGGVDEVADGVDARLTGAAVLVDDDEAAVVDLDLRALEPQLVRERATADRHDARVDLERLVIAEVDGRAARVGGRVAGDLDPGADVDLLLLEALHHHVGDIGVETREDLGETLEDRHLRAQVGEGGRELAPDRSTTDHGHPLGHVIEIEHLVARQDGPTTLEVGDQAWHRPGRQHDVAAGDGGRAAVVHRDGDRHAGTERSDAVEHLDLAAFAHRGDAADEPGDDLLLAGLGDGEVDRRCARPDAEVGAVLDVALDGGRLEERLGRDAPTVEAGTSEGVLLDEGDLQAGRRRVERRGVPAGAASDDDEIERVTHGRHRIVPTHR